MAEAVRPVLNQLNLVAGDIDAMVAFYRRLGVEIEETEPQWERHHQTAAEQRGLDLDFDSREFATTWNRGWPAERAGVVIGFQVPTREAVEQHYAGLTDAGYRGQQEPYDAFWGSRYAIVEDPDGNSVGLMSPMDPGRRTPPPSPPPT
jgi:uncharacterized glyoxalase superfamily protein PhnB